MKSWLVCALFPLARLYEADENMQLSVEERLIHSRGSIAGLPLLLRVAEPPEYWRQQLPMFDPMEILLKIDADSQQSALQQMAPHLDTVIDELSFKIQVPIKVVQLEILAWRNGVQVGDEVESVLLPFPNGYEQFKLRGSRGFGEVDPGPLALCHDYDLLDPYVQDALDWYVKGLHASYDADRYIFYWIAFEIIRGRHADKVEEPTLLRCQHSIDACPECGKETRQYRQKATTVAFIRSITTEPGLADRLWDMRQIVHGAKRFNPGKLSELVALTQWLRAIVIHLIKVLTKMDPDEPPVGRVDTVAVADFPIIYMTRKTDRADVDRMSAILSE